MEHWLLLARIEQIWQLWYKHILNETKYIDLFPLEILGEQDSNISYWLVLYKKKCN